MTLAIKSNNGSTELRRLLKQRRWLGCLINYDMPEQTVLLSISVPG